MAAHAFYGLLLGGHDIMHAKEMILTGLSLSILVYWELVIGEIPLGLFSISQADHPMLFSTLILFKLLVSAVLISLGLRRVIGENRELIRAFLHHRHAEPEKHHKPACHSTNGTLTGQR